MDRGAWWATVYRVAKESDMTLQLNNHHLLGLGFHVVTSFPCDMLIPRPAITCNQTSKGSTPSFQMYSQYNNTQGAMAYKNQE